MNATAERREHNYYTIGTYNEVERLFREEGLKAKEISERVGVPKNTVNNILRSRGIRQRNWSPMKPVIKPEDVQGLIRAYNGGTSISELAIMYNCTTGTIRDYLRRNNVKTDEHAKPMSDFFLSDICRYYRLGWTYEKIAEAVGVKKGTVENYISKQGLANRNAARKDPNWMPGAPLRIDGTPDIRKIEKVEEPKMDLENKLAGMTMIEETTALHIKALKEKYSLKKEVTLRGGYFVYHVTDDSVWLEPIDRVDAAQSPIDRDGFISCARELADIAAILESGEV